MTKPSTSNEDKITAEFVRELFHYDPETGVFTRRVTRQGMHGKAGNIAGTRKPNGYVSISILGANYRAHRLAWLYVHGTWPAGQIDHINRVRSDNRIANLRVVTHAQNMENRKVQRNNTSGYTGVYPDRCGRRWTARISSKGKWLYLGSFRSAEEASTAYRKAAAELHTHNPAANDSHEQSQTGRPGCAEGRRDGRRHGRHERGPRCCRQRARHQRTHRHGGSLRAQRPVLGRARGLTISGGRHYPQGVDCCSQQQPLRPPTF